jgi:medium-chain acyl-[acyl-carrier-protein] hydrolase
VQPVVNSALWLKRFGGSGQAPAARLFCFHHAGGTAAMYRDWPRLLPPSVEPLAVQLPGRADRLREKPYTAMAPLVETLVDVIEPLLDRPFACYGLSMGAKLCWALTHRLRDRAMPMPLALYLAGAAAPGWQEGRADWNIPDEELVGYLREMGGTQPEVFSYPTLLASLLPTLRADLTLVDNFHFQPAEPLDVPIRAFAGTEDVEGGPERMRGWGQQTSRQFTLEAVPGGHFFDADADRRVVRVIAGDLQRELAETVDVP